MSKILKVKGRQIFDSRGNPTVEAEVFTKNNSAKAICPSGASTGTYEAFEKRDKNNKRYLGKGVLNAVNLVNKIISKKLRGHNIHNQLMGPKPQLLAVVDSPEFRGGPNGTNDFNEPLLLNGNKKTASHVGSVSIDYELNGKDESDDDEDEKRKKGACCIIL